MTRALIAILGAAACTGEITASPTGAPDARAANPDAPVPKADAPAADAAPLGAFRLTYYYVANEADYGGAGDTSLFEPGCDLLAVVPAEFAHDVIIEGTGLLDDGRVFNYAGACACALSPCFSFVDADHPWGVGAGGRALVPFRSIAVDKTVLTIGRRYYVAELDGVTMPGPDGFVHDGCLSADDTGGHILGAHIDFFSALRGYYLTLDGELMLDGVTLYEGGARCP